MDWWWWWVSEYTTDATGAFEIDVRWCCGWWPWWWAQRNWQLEPLLVQHIVPVLQRTPTIPRIPLPDPAPDLAIFNEILASTGGGRVTTVQAREAGLPATPAGPRGVVAGRRKPVDPAAVTALRHRLLAALPASAELAQLRIWPWWPWEPWFDCDLDIVFKVTQNCSGQNTVIVNETIWDTRWDIPTTIDLRSWQTSKRVASSPAPTRRTARTATVWSLAMSATTLLTRSAATQEHRRCRRVISIRERRRFSATGPTPG